MKLIMEGWRDFLGKASDSSENKDKEKAPPPSSVVSALMKRAGLSRDEAEKQAKRQVDLEEAMKSSAEEAAAAAEQIQSSPEGQEALEAAAQDPQVQAALERAAAELQQGALQELGGRGRPPDREEREIVGGVVAGGGFGAFATQATALAAWPELMAAVAELPQLAALLGGGAGAVGGLGLALLVNHLRRTGKIQEALEKTTAADVRKSGHIKATTQAATASGVSDEERSVLTNLQGQLAKAAQVDNIASGAILALATKLSALLTQTLATKAPPAPKE